MREGDSVSLSSLRSLYNECKMKASEMVWKVVKRFQRNDLSSPREDDVVLNLAHEAAINLLRDFRSRKSGPGVYYTMIPQ